ncbi:MAG: hemerythrin domain-containing protein [Betaproteobacteria bacterium]
MMDATDYLTRQHRTLEAALRKALDTDDAGAERSQALDIADALTLHLASEEQVFYPAVHEGENEDILLESLEEHLAIKRLLADLLELPGGDPTFQPKLHVLMEQAEHHHKEEENKLFPKVRAEMDADRRAALGSELEALQDRLQLEGKPRHAVREQTDVAEPLR